LAEALTALEIVAAVILHGLELILGEAVGYELGHSAEHTFY